MASNLFSARSAYSRSYNNFRGVDLSSDHTQIDESRFAYAVNMFRDYQSGQGQAVETVPGFRRLLSLGVGGKIYGIHQYKYKAEDGKLLQKLLVHAGGAFSGSLYSIRDVNNPNEWIQEEQEGYLSSGQQIIVDNAPYYKYTVRGITLPSEAEDISITLPGVYETHSISFDGESYIVMIQSSSCAGRTVKASYKLHNIITLSGTMNNRDSVSFMANNRLYILDGKNYIVYDGKEVKPVNEGAYKPSTYIGIYPEQDKTSADFEYEQQNLLSKTVINTFVCDGEVKEFHCFTPGEIKSVRLYGEDISPVDYIPPNDEDGNQLYRVAIDTYGSYILIFPEAPKVNRDYPEGYAGLEIEIEVAPTFYTLTDGNTVTGEEAICGCTLACEFDGRIFLSGNPKLPNHVFFSAINSTGYNDPSYFGALNYVQDGVGISPITALMPVADALVVLKSDTEQDGAVYYHRGEDGGNNITPRIYPSVRGLNGIGCLGACTSFLDDPVFVSRLGLEAIGSLSIKNERCIEHRSSLIDTALTRLNLSDAKLAEWCGYLVLLCEGKIFLADSRQRYTHPSGVMQYEWYYLDGIGVYEGQYKEYRFAESLPDILKDRYVTANDKEYKLTLAERVYDEVLDEYCDLRGEIACDSAKKVENEICRHVIAATEEHPELNIEFVVRDGEALLVRSDGNYIGGDFKPACSIKVINDNLYFGTKNGVICAFNFDKRNEDGQIPPQYYTFDNRTIVCGVATKMDNCGIPHLTKSTLRKSTVIKTKTLPSSVAKVKVRTNNKPYQQIARFGSTVFSFDNLSFDECSLITQDQTLFSIMEKEKRWVEKQYYIYSDEYMKPIALFYVAYRYTVAGRYKE